MPRRLSQLASASRSGDPAEYRLDASTWTITASGLALRTRRTERWMPSQMLTTTFTQPSQPDSPGGQTPRIPQNEAVVRGSLKGVTWSATPAKWAA